MSTRKRLLQKENQIRDKTFKENLKESIHRLHNKTIKNVRKRQYLNNKRLEIRDNISQNGH